MNFLEISPYVFGSDLTWYSVFMLFGAIITYIISDYLYKKEPDSEKCPDLMLNTLIIAFPAGLLGARIWYVLSEWDYYFNDPIEILKVWNGGLAIQGGVMLGVIVGAFYVVNKCRRCGISIKLTRLMDIVIPNILIAQVIGRWGNFFNREVYGECVDHLYALKNWWMLPEWLVNNMAGGSVNGVYVSCPPTQYAQPLFLYEGILNFCGFIIISIILRKFFTRRVDGTLAALYLVWYGAVRASIEGLRDEAFIMRWGNISQSLVTSIFFVIVGVSFIAFLYIKDIFTKKKINGIGTLEPSKVEEKREEAKVSENNNDVVAKHSVKTNTIDKNKETKESVEKKSAKTSKKKATKADEE